MKKFILTSVLSLAFLSSCSKDKNDLQPKLGAAQRSPINQPVMAAAPRPGQQMPEMIGTDQSGSQAEVFINRNVGLGNVPSAIPGAQNPATPGIMPAQPQMPVNMGMMNQQMQQPIQPPMTPPQAASADPVVIATISKKKTLPASLMANYNNPLNYEKIPAYPQPTPMAAAPMMAQPMPFSNQPMMQQPVAQQPMAQPMIQPIAGIPVMTQPVGAPTQPVADMQMYTQPTGGMPNAGAQAAY